jgi:signal transduction histidine kinase
MTILIVDDSEDIQLSITAFLKAWGYSVVTASNGKEAWEILQQQDISLVISDWTMPVMTGIELCRTIRSAAINRYIYVILLTANSEKSDLIVGMDAGADDFLVKPFDYHELRVCIRAGERIIGLEQRLKEQQRRLVETNAALIQSEKLATLGSIAGSVAHELNSPLGAILNAAERLQGTLTDMGMSNNYVDYVTEDLDLLISAALHSRSVIANLLDSARVSQHGETCVLGDVLDGWMRLYKKQFDMYGITLDAVVGEQRPLLLGYAALSQIFTNLLINARDAVIEQPEHQRFVNLHAAPHENMCRIVIADTGTGIPPEIATRLFEAFVTTKESGKGTGLGLWVIRSIVSSVGGTITLQNRAEGGAEAVVELPCLTQQQSTSTSTLFTQL